RFPPVNAKLGRSASAVPLRGGGRGWQAARKIQGIGRCDTPGADMAIACGASNACSLSRRRPALLPLAALARPRIPLQTDALAAVAPAVRQLAADPAKGEAEAKEDDGPGHARACRGLGAGQRRRRRTAQAALELGLGAGQLGDIGAQGGEVTG